MSTTGAFFIGEGKGARFIGGVHSDGYPREKDEAGGIPPLLLKSITEDGFLARVQGHLRNVAHGERITDLTWEKAKNVHYIYCFFEGHVWITNSGSRWYNDQLPANLKPSKIAPSAPVATHGTLDVDVKMQCGECRRVDTIDRKEFHEKHPPFEWSARDLYAYFESRGWHRSEAQGWLCPDCK